jgi:hypothetical protein
LLLMSVPLVRIKSPKERVRKYSPATGFESNTVADMPHALHVRPLALAKSGAAFFIWLPLGQDTETLAGRHEETMASPDMRTQSFFESPAAMPLQVDVV